MIKNRYKEYNNIGIIVLIVGLINIYNIIKYGTKISIPTNTTPIHLIDNITDKMNIIGSISIERGNISIGIISSIIILIIFNISSLASLYNLRLEDREGVLSKKEGSLEYEVLVGLGLVGLIGIIISKELITLYLSIELYSFTTYILILVKESNIIRRLSIIYLITSSIASGLILIGIYLIYNNYGVVDLENIRILMTIDSPIFIGDLGGGIIDRVDIIIYLLTIAILFKIGAYPFYNIILRVYADIEKRILIYQLTIPKMIMIILLLRFIDIFNISILYKSYILNPLFLLLFIASILSIIVGAISPLYHNRDNILLSYSSLLNIGYILLAISIILYTYPRSYIMNENMNIIEGVKDITSIWIIYEYMIVYIINVLGLVAGIFLTYKSSIVYNMRTLYMYPYYYISMFIIIASFIGIPPLSGFFIKLHIIFIIFDYSLISIISISILILASLFSSILYLKFLLSSTTSTTFSTTTLPYLRIPLGSYILSIATIFSITYPIYISLLYPIYSLLQ